VNERAPKTWRSPKAIQRGAARMAAAQAIYQIELTQGSIDGVLREFVDHRLGAGLPEDGTVGEADRGLFVEIVRGAAGRAAELDKIVASVLAPGWVLDRMDRVLRAILRAGAFELFARAETPAKVAISEYVDIARAFYEGKEPGFVNGVLDRLARVLRPGEMPEAPAKAADAPESEKPA
jgi:N utilization substance protein B